MILLIDNYDSFVHNLARYFERLGVDTRVVRNDQVSPSEVVGMKPDAIIISPGPCTPDEAGCSLEVVKRFHDSIPMFGVCLGHQVIAQSLGGRVVRGSRPWHGRASSIVHDSSGIFAGLPSPLVAGRYHSLVVDADQLPIALKATAWTDDRTTLMAFTHRSHPVVGVQFHPESILTEHGYAMLRNFLRSAGVAVNADVERLRVSEQAESPRSWKAPTRPVTF